MKKLRPFENYGSFNYLSLALFLSKERERRAQRKYENAIVRAREDCSHARAIKNELFFYVKWESPMIKECMCVSARPFQMG